MLQRWREIEKLCSRAQEVHHRSFAVDPMSWKLSGETIDFLKSVLRPQMATLEAGVSLASLILMQSHVRQHILMSTSAQRERLLEVCLWEQLSSARLTASLDELGPALQRLPQQPLFDLILLVDQGHFPTSATAWQKLTRRLKTGGYLILDNFDHPLAPALFYFLRRHPHWQMTHNCSWRGAVFRKLNPAAGETLERHFPLQTHPRARVALALGRTLWGPLSGNCYWQKRLGRWSYEELYVDGWLAFYESVLVPLHLYGLRKIYFHGIRKTYLHTIHVGWLQLYRLVFRLIPSWAYKGYAYGRTLLWSINLPEWPGLASMYFWKLIPAWCRREPLRRFFRRLLFGEDLSPLEPKT